MFNLGSISAARILYRGLEVKHTSSPAVLSNYCNMSIMQERRTAEKLGKKYSRERKMEWTKDFSIRVIYHQIRTKSMHSEPLLLLAKS